MGIFDRITNLAKANLNDLIDKAEDPEKIAKQVIYDLEEAYKEASAGVAASIAEEKKLHSLLMSSEEESQKWEKRAMAAIEKGDDALAKEALKKRISFDDDAKRFKAEHENRLDQVRDLKESLKLLEEKIEDAKRRRDSLIARSKSASAQAKIAKTMNSVSHTDPLEALKRMEEKVIMEESVAVAYTELKSESTEAKFAAIEKEVTVDEALSALKSKMNKE